MLTLKQFATKAQLPESHIRKLAQEGTLQSEKIANNWVIYDHVNAVPSQKGKRIQQSTLNTVSQIIAKNEVEFKHAQHKQHIYKLIQEFYENPAQKAYNWRYRNGVTLLKLAVPDLVLEQIEKNTLIIKQAYPIPCHEYHLLCSIYTCLPKKATYFTVSHILRKTCTNAIL